MTYFKLDVYMNLNKNFLMILTSDSYAVLSRVVLFSCVCVLCRVCLVGLSSFSCSCVYVLCLLARSLCCLVLYCVFALSCLLSLVLFLPCTVLSCLVLLCRVLCSLSLSCLIFSCFVFHVMTWIYAPVSILFLLTNFIPALSLPPVPLTLHHS